MKLIANTISVLFNPILLLTYLSGILLYVFHSFTTQSPELLILMVFVFSFVIPSLLLPLLKRLGLIESIMLKNRKERLIPYVTTALFYFYTAYLLHDKQVYPLLVHLFIYAGGVILLISCINLFFKISAHALSMVSLVGFVLVFIFQNNRWEYIVTLLVLLLTTGLVISCRKYLKAHDYFELLMGSSIGLIIGAFGSYIIM